MPVPYSLCGLTRCTCCGVLPTDCPAGYPVRVHKTRAVVRLMFFNPDDVRWFKPLELWTKSGRRGRITEPLGTHGAFKARFDGPISQVCWGVGLCIAASWVGEPLGGRCVCCRPQCLWLTGSVCCSTCAVCLQRDSVCISLYKRVYSKWPAAPAVSAGAWQHAPEAAAEARGDSSSLGGPPAALGMATFA